MAFRGFGKNSGPSTPPRAQTLFGHFPRPPSYSTLSVSPRSPVDYGDLGAFEGMASPHLASSHPFPAIYKSNEPPLRRGEMKVSSVGDRGPQTYQRPPGLQPLMGPSNTRAGTLAGAAEVQYIGRTNSSYSRSPHEVSKNFRGVSEIPSDLPLSNNRYMVPYRAQLPPLVFQNNQNVGGQLSHSEEVQHDVNEKELTALKAVIKCIEDHKLEEQFPVDQHQKQVLEIEKAKANKKHATEVAKPQSKRLRANGIAHAPTRVANVATYKNFHGRMTDNRYPQYMYERPPYAYPAPPADHHVQSFLGTPNHGNFFGNAYQYQSVFLH